MQLRHLARVTLISITSILAFGKPAATIEPQPLFAVLLGGNEVSSTGQANAGDGNGVGSATVTISLGSILSRNPNPNINVQGKLCYGLTVANIGKPTAAHIHRGKAGTNGSIVVNLMPPTDGNPGASSGCVNVPITQLVEIQANPSSFYVNIHNAEFPNGAIRGQLY
jgi:hypothetical protein